METNGDNLYETNAPKKPANYSSWLIIYFPLLLALALSMGIYFGSQLNPLPKGAEKESLSKINHVMKLIEENYVDEIDRSKLTEEALSNILSGLDPHSAYLTPEMAKKSQEELSGNFGGVGIQFIVHKDTLVVTHIIEGGPAENEDIRPFDRIIKVDTTSFAGRDITTDDVFKSLRGQVGSIVHLTIQRPGEKELVKKELMRGLIPVSPIEASIMLDEETGYIKLSQFGENTMADFIEAVIKLKRDGMKRLVFDLRDNGGGLLNQANDLADEFLDAGKMIVYTEGAHSPRRTYKATAKGRLENNPVVVLINHNSASASEIVAGALQDNDRGIIMGRRSFGKGLVQQELPIGDDGSRLRLTIARYYTPTGRCIQKPYGNGIDYEREQRDRYENNEFFHPDSSVFVDSLKKKTPGGKIVYGGGGINPDIFIPLDTTGRSDLYSQLMYGRTFAEYAFDFIEKHKNFSSRYKSYKEYASRFTIDEVTFMGLIEYARARSIYLSEADVKHSEELIKNYLKAEIGRLIWNSDGFYSVIAKRDNDIQRALEKVKQIN